MPSAVFRLCVWHQSASTTLHRRRHAVRTSTRDRLTQARLGHISVPSAVRSSTITTPVTAGSATARSPHSPRDRLTKHDWTRSVCHRPCVPAPLLLPSPRDRRPRAVHTVSVIAAGLVMEAERFAPPRPRTEPDLSSVARSCLARDVPALPVRRPSYCHGVRVDTGT